MTNLHFLKPPLDGSRPHAAEAPICDAERAASRPHHAAKIITSANCCAHLLESGPDQCTDIEMTESLTARCGLSGSLSPTYRNRVRNLSPRNRNQGVQHLPDSHTAVNAQCDGQMTARRS